MTGRLAVTVAAACLVSAGCSHTVSGTAVRASGSAPHAVSTLRAAQLDHVLVDLPDLAALVGAPELDVIGQLDEMSDNADVVSDPGCLGTVMGAEKSVYAGSGWTAVRDQVSGDQLDEHWVEQTAVLFGSEAQAKAFHESSQRTWRDCAGYSVSVDDVDVTYVWEVGDLESVGGVLAQRTVEQGFEEWQCGHALAQAANLVVETWTCSYDEGDEAVRLAERMLANAATA